MSAATQQLLIGIDAGTSVIKAVAFTLSGEQVGVAALANRFVSGADGSATQDMSRTWQDCAATLRALGEKIPDLAMRTAAIAVTGQGDGTWLVGRDNAPVSDAWLWLDARAASTVGRLNKQAGERTRFETTGTGLSTCQQGAQLAYMMDAAPELLSRAEVALHCKDWLFLNLTGVRASDPSEASLTFGDFRTRRYDDRVIEALGLDTVRRLLPPIVDGAAQTFPLTDAAAKATGLLAGTPVSLGFMDIVSTGLGAGVYTRGAPSACTVIGSTGIHMKAVWAEDFYLNAENTGYAIVLPVPGLVAQIQSNMAATLNIDWVLGLAADAGELFGPRPTHAQLVARIGEFLEASRPGQILYHPYISDAGERGPFINAEARASFVGLRMGHHYADLVRAVVEGLGLAARDCYSAMNTVPAELRLSGGAVRSAPLRRVLSAAVGAPVQLCGLDEAGAAGSAMMAAVAIGAYASMDDCLDRWVLPRLGAREQPDTELAALYASRFAPYQTTRETLRPIWSALAAEPVAMHGASDRHIERLQA